MTEDWLTDVAERIDAAADYGADRLPAAEQQLLAQAAVVVRQLAETDWLAVTS